MAGAALCLITACVTTDAGKSGEFADDVDFMKKHTPIVLLKDGDAAVAVAPAYQGRVMTSTFDRKAGPSFGWINRPVIEKGFLSEEEKKGKLEEHIYVFGGEERLWFGPEGGQFAIFFQPGVPFTFDHWFTPPCIDTEAFRVTDKTSTQATFAHTAKLKNWSGQEFDMAIRRTVRLLARKEIATALDIELPDTMKMVAYETDNRLTNAGKKAWTKASGMLSIWILGMYPPSPGTTVVIPFHKGDKSELGPKVNDTYFGKVPQDHLKVKDDVLFFRADGTRRGKIGIGPKRSKYIAGSYNADLGVLNVVTCNRPKQPHPGYVNSMWEMQKDPFSGDVINAYNDGSPAPGKPPLGPFYELETSSPAGALKPGETLQHIQRTFHLKGTPEQLDRISRKLFGVSLTDIQEAL